MKAFFETAKKNGVYDSTDVNNTAIEHRQNTSDSKQTKVTYEKEPTYDVSKTATASSTDEDGNWLPGSEVTYTLTIGNAETDMAGVNIKDVMTDLQTLEGDVMIKVGNGSQMKLSDYVAGAITWSDDGQYSTNDVELFNFNMPSSAGKGPVVITYKTKIIDQAKNGNWYVEVTAVPSGAEALLVYNSPIIPYESPRELADESNFYNAAGEVVKAYTLIIGEVFEVSAEAFTGTPVKGKALTVASKKLVVAA